MKLDLPPPTTISKNVPKLPVQDTQQFNNWPWKIQANLKVLHLKVDKVETKFIEKLIEVAKKKNTLKKCGANKYTSLRW